MEKSKVELKVNGKNDRLRPKLSELMVLITSVFEVAFWDDKEKKEVTQLDKQVINFFYFNGVVSFVLVKNN